MDGGPWAWVETLVPAMVPGLPGPWPGAGPVSMGLGGSLGLKNSRGPLDPRARSSGRRTLQCPSHFSYDTQAAAAIARDSVAYAPAGGNQQVESARAVHVTKHWQSRMTGGSKLRAVHASRHVHSSRRPREALWKDQGFGEEIRVVREVVDEF